MNKKIFVLFFLASMLLALNFFGGYGALRGSAQSNCSNDSSASQEASILSSMNLAEAESVAQPSVNAQAGDFKSSFDSRVGIFGQNPDCSVYVEAYKLGYSLSDASGVQRVVVVVENPTLTR